MTRDERREQDQMRDEYHAMEDRVAELEERIDAAKQESDRQMERAQWWETKAAEYRRESDYYRQQLVDAHALLGRVIHQASERWGSVNLTEYFPTDNLHHKRGVGNPTGEANDR